MKTLNLADPEKSDILFKISKFPDGQQDVTITDTESIKAPIWSIMTTHSVEGKSNKTGPLRIQPVQIKSRFNSFKDLELIICATICLRRLGVKEIHLYIPYIVGARSDREFIVGGTSYLRDVIAPILNYQKYESVTCIDPHSDVAAACINNLKIIDNVNIIKFALSDLNTPNQHALNKSILVSPDAGAQKKVYKIADVLGYKEEVITCSKLRDNEGKLSRTSVPVSIHNVDKDLIIIDDICDGGATFINIAKAAIEQRKFSSAIHPDYYGKIYLIITHGIFSKGLKELNQYFDGIYCTNSYIDMNDKMFSLENDKHLYKLKQLNIF